MANGLLSLHPLHRRVLNALQVGTLLWPPHQQTTRPRASPKTAWPSFSHRSERSLQRESCFSEDVRRADVAACQTPGFAACFLCDSLTPVLALGAPSPELELRPLGPKFGPHQLPMNKNRGFMFLVSECGPT